MRGGIYQSKRGLSAVVTTLLIILLAIVLIGVVWVVIRNVINQGAQGINLEQFTLDLSIKSAVSDGTNASVEVTRTGSGNLTGIKFVFNGGGSSVVVTRHVTIQQAATMKFIFNSTEIPGIGPGDTVSVAPLFVTSTNVREQTGQVTDTKTLSSGTVEGTGGTGSGTGGTGGENPPPPTGTEYCGDNIIQQPNGDGINEICDGTDLNGQTCSGLGYGGGTLLCASSCQNFDTSQCTQQVPTSCDGTWTGTANEDAGVVCDGGAHCDVDCTCLKGYSPDNLGGCNLSPPIDNGTVNSVWNNIYFDSQNFPKDSLTMNSYQSDYVNFTGSAETGCFQITFADYLVSNNISYVRLDNSISTPNITSGNGYQVWEAANCGQ